MKSASGGRRGKPRRFFYLIAGAIIAAAVAVAAGLWYGPDIPTLTLSRVDTGQTVWQRKLPAGSPFSLEYTHSIHLTPVLETFFIDSGSGIVLDQLRYDSLGVGNPSGDESGGSFRMEDGVMIIEGINRKLGSFRLSVGQVIAHHRLHIEGEIIPLSSVTPPGSTVLVHVKPSFAMLLKGLNPFGRTRSS